MAHAYPGQVLAYNTTTGQKSHVPEHWLGDESPFPGQWKAAPSTVEAASTATGTATGTDAPADAPQRPADSASKADWTAYATALGYEGTESLTRAELITLTAPQEA